MADVPANKYGNVSEALYTVLSERVCDVQDIEMRWKKTFASIFSSLTKIVSRFFASRIKSDEATQVQSAIWRLFMKSDYEEKIREDAELQNVFLLGYCRAVEEMINSFESVISLNENDSLKSIVSSYKHMKPVLLCLDKHFQISHKELAKKIGISESSLSNFMNKVQIYNLFDSARVGKKRYYSLSYPDGEKALKFVKEYDKSLPEGYTDCLLKLFSFLQTAVSRKDIDEERILNECEDMFFQYTTKPALCKQQLNNLFSSLHGEKLFSSSLVKLEIQVKESVTIFTKNIKSEEEFIKAIKNNLDRQIKYYWFVEKSDEFDSEEKIKEYLCEKLSPAISENISRNGFYCLKSEEEMKYLLGEDSDVVIYDEEYGYSSMEERISEKTPYVMMPMEELGKLRKYAEDNRGALHSLGTEFVYEV